MPSPFPGMDPYLENLALWRDFHQRLATQVADQLQPLIRPRYVAQLEPRIEIGAVAEPVSTVVAYPDLGVSETPAQRRPMAASAIAPAPLLVPAETLEEMKNVAVHVRQATDLRLVTVIEILSPINKRPGNDDRVAYLRKRQRLMQTDVHLLELDLLRNGERVPAAKPFPNVPYLVILSRAWRRDHYEVWPIALPDSLPTVPVPLLTPDPDALLDLALAVRTVYDKADYGLLIDYTKDPAYPLPSEWAEWTDAYLRAQGIREKEKTP